MSLHLGNLSPRIRRDELERIFRRFGRCTVRMKDKFGFVVYEYPPNAEKALGALRGTRICGERITLSWSKKQPQPSQRYARRGRKNEQLQGRHIAQEDFANRKFGSAAPEGHRRGFQKADGPPDLIDGAKHNGEGYVGEKGHGLPDDGGCFEANMLGNDRWGELVVANDSENELDFDRYEPCLDDDVKLQEGIHYSTHLDHSPTARKSQEKPETEQMHQVALEHPNSRPPNSCQGSGEVDRKIRKCPKEVKKLETRSGLHLDREIASRAWHNIDTEPSTSRNRRRLVGYGDSSDARLISPCIENDYQEKKQSSKEYGTSDKQLLKKARVPVSSSIHSDYTASGSRSPSRSRKSLSCSHPHSSSKPMASRKHSFSSSSRSGSTSSHPRTIKIESQQISRSSSPTSLSLSISLDRPLQSSPKKIQRNQDCLVSSSGREFKEGSAGVDNSSGTPITPEENEKNSHSPRRDGTRSIMENVIEMKRPCLPLSENSNQNPETFASKTLTEMRESKNVREDKLIQMKSSEIEASQRSIVASLMRVSSKEMCMVLKNCGQKLPDEIEGDLPPEMYFGSGRLWPWEVIYYRRLKKGPISKENYARRLSQNQEFGIVDKYIRSSSGWGELTNENP